MEPKNFLKIKEIENFISNIDKEEQILLFHSGTADQNDNLNYGVEGGFGSWLEEVLNGATDDEELFNEIKENTCLSFYSEKPDWVTAKISKKLKKHISEITDDDIINHGQLCILIIDKDDYDFKRAGNREESYVEKTTYLNGEDADYDIPFGVETGDIYSTARLNPVDYVLIGEDLLCFLNRNYPNVNISFENTKKKHTKYKF